MMTNEEKLTEDLKNFRINIGDEYVTVGSWRLTDSEASNIAAYLARKGWTYNQELDGEKMVDTAYSMVGSEEA